MSDDNNDGDLEDMDENEDENVPQGSAIGTTKPEGSDASDPIPNLLKASVQLDHFNFPFICETYKDPLTRMDVVLLMVNLPGGAQNTGVELNSEGTVVTFKYQWAKAWYDVKELFKKFIAAKETTIVHPMVGAVENALEKCRSHIDSAPEAKMVITLPIKVQTDPFTWKKNGISRPDGMQIVMIEFVGFIKQYHKIKENSTFAFDR